jgi:hypothetical protein
MDSGQIAGIVIGALATGALIMFGILKGRDRFYTSGPYVEKAYDYFSLVNWFKVLYYFLPYALFLFGVVYDGLARQIRLFPAGFIGLANVYLNHFISTAFGGTMNDQDICGIPGMANIGSQLAPQNILFTSTVLSYIASYVTAKPYTNVQWIPGTVFTQPISSQTYSGIAWAGVFAVWALQTVIFNMTGCHSSSGWLFAWGSGANRILPPLYGLAGGMLVGGIAGWQISSLDKTAGIQPGNKPTPEEATGPLSTQQKLASGTGTCSATGDDDQFVCEAYKNGELVTSTIVE